MTVILAAPMHLNLPDAISPALQPLFDALPLGDAMSALVVMKPGKVELVEAAVRDPAIRERPALQAGLWLYVDDLDRSHDISQQMKNATGSFWHGVMHRREGDFSNSHYWFRRAGRHPAMDALAGYDAHAFIDEVEAAHRQGEAPAELVEKQRREWAVLFEWCAAAAAE